VGEILFGAKARVGGDLFGVDPQYGARGSRQRLEAVAIGGAGLHPLGEDDLMRAVDGIYERERERERENNPPSVTVRRATRPVPECGCSPNSREAIQRRD
jgi:hypothetical protein